MVWPGRPAGRWPELVGGVVVGGDQRKEGKCELGRGRQGERREREVEKRERKVQ